MQKHNKENHFDLNNDQMIIVFDADIFETKVEGYNELIEAIEENDIAAISNPGFELFLLLHIPESFEKYIALHEEKFFQPNKSGSYSYAYQLLHDLTGMNAKKNPKIGDLAENIQIAIEQEKNINQDIHNIHGKGTSNIAAIIQQIIDDDPNK